MSSEETEKTRWGIVLVGLAVAGGIAWWGLIDNSDNNNASIVEPVSRDKRPSGAAPPAPRDFVSDLSKKGMTVALNPVAAVPKSALYETLKRPLFAQTRRPPAPPPPRYTPPPPPPIPPNPNDLKLIGVMVASDGAVALVRTKSSPNTISVRRGEIIDGWTIDDINSREMKVRKKNVSATIVVSSGSSPFSPMGGMPRRPQGTLDPSLSDSELQPDERVPDDDGLGRKPRPSDP